MKIIYNGGPCTCEPGRYIRFITPRVPGCIPAIHCRDNCAGKEGKNKHPIPKDAVIALRVPDPLPNGKLRLQKTIRDGQIHATFVGGAK